MAIGRLDCKCYEILDIIKRIMQLFYLQARAF